MADVTLTYKGDTILELSASGQKSIDTQGFYCDANILLNYVKPSGGNVQYATGSYTPTQDYDTEGNRLITDTQTIGFTPKFFFLVVRDKSQVANVLYAVLRSSYEYYGSSGGSYRTTVRYSNSSNLLSAHISGVGWTNQTNYYLYKNGDNIYYRTYSTFILKSGVTYDWYAFRTE